MTDVILTAQNRIKYWIYFISATLMGIFGVEAIGRIVPSIPILVVMGMLFFPVLELILSLVGLGKPASETVDKPLAFKYPSLLLLFGLCFILTGWLLIAGGDPQKSRDLKGAFLGGMMLYFPIQLFLSWVKMRKIGISNE